MQIELRFYDEIFDRILSAVKIREARMILLKSEYIAEHRSYGCLPDDLHFEIFAPEFFGNTPVKRCIFTTAERFSVEQNFGWLFIGIKVKSGSITGDYDFA